MKTTVVIPTKNEEAWIETTLSVLANSKDVSQIIIVDNDCGNEIKNIASRYSCLLLQDTTPAKSRNTGAKASHGEFIVFVDADIIVPPDCIRCAVECLSENQNVGIVHFKIKPMTNNFFVNFSYLVMNYYFRFLSFLGFSQGIGNFIAVKRNVFDSIGGFDENIRAGEDVDFFRRASKFKTISYMINPMIYASTRRFSIENPYLFSLKCVMWSVLRLFGLKNSIIGYKWEEYESHIANKDQVWVEKNLPQIYNNMNQLMRKTRG